MNHSTEHMDPFFKAFQDALGDYEAKVPEMDMQADWDKVSQQMPTPVPQMKPSGLKGLSVKSLAVVTGSIAIVATAVLITVSALREDAPKTTEKETSTVTEMIPKQEGNTAESGLQIAGRDAKSQKERDTEGKEKSEALHRDKTTTESTSPSEATTGNQTAFVPQTVAPKTPGVFSSVHFSDTFLCMNEKLIIRNTGTENSSTGIDLILPDKEIKDFKGTMSYSFSHAGTFTIKIVSIRNGQSLQTQQKIYVFSEPFADFDMDATDMPTIKFINRSSNADSYKWIFDNDQSSEKISPSFTFIRSGTYPVKLMATNRYGCQSEMQKNAEIVVEEGRFKEPYIPNIFSPNGDGMNDYYFITIEDEVLFQLNIIDRNGTSVFTSVSKEKKWDGRNENNGKDCPDGNYFYVFKYQLKGQVEAVKKTGTIYLEK